MNGNGEMNIPMNPYNDEDSYDNTYVSPEDIINPDILPYLNELISDNDLTDNLRPILPFNPDSNQFPDGNIDVGMTITPSRPGGNIDSEITITPSRPGGNIDPGMTLPLRPSRPIRPIRPVPPINTIPMVFRNCLRGLVYVQMKNGEAFWMIPINVYQNSVSGYRWNPSYGWNGWYPQTIRYSDVYLANCVTNFYN